MATQFKFRRDTSLNWSVRNPVLAEGEPGLETDTGKLKIGNGSSTWSQLAYFAGSGGVSSAGYTGSSGYTGSNGLLGYAGSRGNAGYAGSQGPVGAGYTGSAGTNGTVGYTGSQGIGSAYAVWSTSAPDSPQLGLLWYDSQNSHLMIYNGTTWLTLV